MRSPMNTKQFTKIRSFLTFEPLWHDNFEKFCKNLRLCISCFVNMITYDKFPKSIPFDPKSNTYILGEYDEYLSKRSKSA